MDLFFLYATPLFLSATPFCPGVCGIVNCLLIPFCLQYPSNSLEVYSPPLFDLSARILLPVWFSARALNSWNFCKDLLKFLALQEVYPCLPRMVIDECHIVLISSQRNKRHRSTQIWMYQVKNPCWPAITARKSSLGVLSKSTLPANITLLWAEIW